ncbi:hypothetical protein PMEGAS67_19400 [Priestia megaterium]
MRIGMVSFAILIGYIIIISVSEIIGRGKNQIDSCLFCLYFLSREDSDTFSYSVILQMRFS